MKKLFEMGRRRKARKARRRAKGLEEPLELQREKGPTAPPSPDKVEAPPQPDEEAPDIDPEELAKGIEIEKEHSETLAEELAKDHLKEIPDYYTRLEKMEADALAEHGTGESEPSDADELFDNLKEASKRAQINPPGMEHVCAYCQSVYNNETGEPIRKLTSEEYAQVQSHGICKLCTEEQMRQYEEFRAQRQTSKLTLKKEGLWPFRKPEEEPAPTEEEVVEPVARIEPPQFQTRRSPGVTEEPAEATTAEAELIRGLTASKTQVDSLKNEVAQLQRELQEKIAPVQAQIGAEGQKQLQATKQLASLMTSLGHTLVQIDNQVGYYTEQAVSRKLTPSEKIKALLDKFGADAERVLADAQKNIDEMERVVVGKYRQWPTKGAADIGAEEQHLAALYQNTFNALSDILKDAQELNVSLMSAA